MKLEPLKRPRTTPTPFSPAVLMSAQYQKSPFDSFTITTGSLSQLQPLSVGGSPPSMKVWPSLVEKP